MTAVAAQAQKQQIRIGDIEYFGSKGVDVKKVKRLCQSTKVMSLSLDALPDLVFRIRLVNEACLAAPSRLALMDQKWRTISGAGL